MTMPQSLATDTRYQGRLVEILHPQDMPEYFKNSPVEGLILAENFGRPISPSGRPELLICTCIEFRYALPVPSMHAFVIRRATGRLIGSEFSIAYALSRGVEHIVIIGHNDCGMTTVADNTKAMTEALVREGWHHDRAQEFVAYHAARYAIEDELTALEHEYVRLKRLFKRVHISPLFVCLADSKFYVPRWYHEHVEMGKELPRLAEQAAVPDEELLTIT